jgi:GT2 family glycosyltransferase
MPEKNKPLITISLVNYNGMKTLPDTLDSAFALTWPDLEFIIVDQVSADGSREYITQYLMKHAFPGNIQYVQNKRNTGFAGGHNQVIRQSRGEYIFCLNPDLVIRQSDFFDRMIEVFEKDPLIAGVQPKLLRYDFDKHSPVIKGGKNIIDTTGLMMLKNRRIVNRGQSAQDIGQFESGEEIFGVDGAAPLFKRAALEDIKMPMVLGGHNSGKEGACEYFDEDFLAYKEDVDLSWRMRLFGWKLAYCPKAVAFHGRGSGESADIKYIGVIRERRKISLPAKRLSFRNQRLMQMKNEQWSILLRHAPRLIIKEILAWGYVLVFETSIFFGVLAEVFRMMPRMMEKRRFVMEHKKAPIKEVLKWFL